MSPFGKLSTQAYQYLKRDILDIGIFKQKQLKLGLGMFRHKSDEEQHISKNHNINDSINIQSISTFVIPTDSSIIPEDFALFNKTYTIHSNKPVRQPITHVSTQSNCERGFSLTEYLSTGIRVIHR